MRVKVRVRDKVRVRVRVKGQGEGEGEGAGAGYLRPRAFYGAGSTEKRSRQAILRFLGLR